MRAVLVHLPNSLTLLRLLLTVPIGMLILCEQFGQAMAVAFVAGCSDALDGYLARRLDARSKLGAILDPVADKLLITVAFVTTSQVGLVPWWLTAVVIARDVVIISGAACYKLLLGTIDYQPTTLSKGNMFVQVGFCILVLSSQVVAGIPAILLYWGQWLVLVMALVSGSHYVALWSARARRAYREQQQ